MKLFRYIVIIFSILFLLIVPVLSNDEPAKVFLKMRNLYSKWNDGLFGSRKYYKGRLKRYLVSCLDKEIETGFDFVPGMPESIIRRKIYSEFVFHKWLVVHGVPGEKSMRELKRKGWCYRRNIGKMKYLYSVSGKIRKFRLTELSGKRRIHLYLDNFEIKSIKEK